MMKQHLVLTCALFALLCVSTLASAGDLPDYLAKGSFPKGIADYKQRVKGDTASNGDRFSLGVLELIDALEHLAQDFHRLGLDKGVGQKVNLPFLRLPVASNPKPEVATPEAIRKVMEDFYARISSVNKALQNLDDKEFNIPIDISAIRFDFDGNQQLADHEYFHHVYTSYNRRSENLFSDGKSLVINFDLGDAYWLKGYSHLLMAMLDTILAHQWDKVYEQTAHVFFARVSSDIGSTLQKQNGPEYSIWADLVAGVHVMNPEVIAPERLVSAHANLIKVIECSRLSWSHIEQETDNQQEWIPNPKQTGVTGVQISQEILDGWKEFLKEFENILTGKKLVPHWRIEDGRGINLKRVFHEPRPLDLVLWIQGSAAIPYLEVGEISSAETWDRIIRVFQGDFIGFAIWVN